MYDRTGNYLIVAILIGMILGVVVVALFGEAVLPVKFLGDIFLNALKMVVIPLLFCSMIVGITNLGDVRKLGRTGLKTLLYFLATSSIAVVIGLVLVNIIQPGAGFDTFGASVPHDAIGSESYSFFAWLTDQIPSNIIGAAAETQVLPIIVFALFFGGVLTTIGAKGKPVIEFFEGLNEAIMKIVHIIMWYAPIGIFGLVAGQLAANGGLSGFSGVLSALGKYSLVVLLGLLIHGVIVLPLILKFMGGKSPVEYFVGMSQAVMTAFATASSSATLPVTMDCAEEKNDIDKRSTSFVLPLGATINMDGTALYEAVAAMFIAQAYGIALPIWSQITIFATAVLASVGAAGIPQAGLVTMVLVLQAVGLPLEGIGLILAIDWFLDRCRTAVNVWGDSVGAAVIATTAEIGLVDRSRLKKVRSDRPARFERFTRRRDTRGGPRKSQESTPAYSRERAISKGKKPGGPVGPRRPTRTSRKSDRSSDRRAPQRDKKSDGFTATAKREEYKPREVETKEKPVQNVQPSKPQAPSTDKPIKADQEKKKQSFGRRRSRPQRTHAKSQGDNAKASKSEESGSDRAQQPASEKRSGMAFEVPKFPASILDDLVAEEKGGSAEMPEVIPGAEVGDSNGAGAAPMALMADDDSQADDTEATKIEARDDSESVTDDPSESVSAAGDFARLDEAVLGSSEAHQPADHERLTDKTEDLNPFSGSDDHSYSEPDSDSAADETSEPESDFSTRDTGDLGNSDSGDGGEEIPSFSTVGETDSPETESVEDTAVPEHADLEKEHMETEKDFQTEIPDDIDARQSESDEPVDDSNNESDETTDVETISEESDTKNDSMKWGRPKHKKMSR